MKFYFIVLWMILCRKIIGENEEKEDLDKFTEFKNTTSQTLLILSPSRQCRCHQRTLFFKPQNFTEKDLENSNVYKVVIKNKEYYVGDFQSFSRNPNSKFTYECLSETLKSNHMIRLFNTKVDSNLYWYNHGNSNIVKKKLNRYQKYNHFLRYNELTRKDLLYTNYYRFKQKFPKDFTYMMETYTSSLNWDQMEERFKNYKLSMDDLWLVKPKGLSRGRGIHFFEGMESLSKQDILTKYISDPLLIEQKKFDLRIYILVTGHNPLKVYIYKEGFAKIASDEFNLQLEDLSNLYRHLTNVSINKKRRSNKSYRYEANLWSLEKVKNYLEETYGIAFEDIWKGIEDLAIKSLITMTHIETKKEQNAKVHPSNLFELYGLDIMIDRQLKPWLLEINLSPDLAIHGNYEKKLKYQLIRDVMNIVGIVPYSHINGLAMEGECEFENSVEEAIQQAICEFTRPLGEFKRIFPVSDNIDYYMQFFEKITTNNQALWDELQMNDSI